MGAFGRGKQGRPGSCWRVNCVGVEGSLERMNGEKCKVVTTPTGGEPHSAFTYPGSSFQCVASLVRIALFAAAPLRPSQPHRRATSHSMPRFSGRRVYRLPVSYGGLSAATSVRANTAECNAPPFSARLSPFTFHFLPPPIRNQPRKPTGPAIGSIV
jgi:hypothetical protein